MTAPFEQIIQHIMKGEKSPEFRKFVEMLPDNYWAKYDLSAVRLGWEAYKALQEDRKQAVIEFDLYQCNADDSARFSLGKDGERKIIVVGLNPSTATQDKSDATITKVAKATQMNGYDGFVMANLYALRSTDPAGLPKNADTELMKQNVRAIADLAADGGVTIWAAWGTKIDTRSYLIEALAQIREQVTDAEWRHFGPLTKDGHPSHPSRLSFEWEFSNFEVDNYLAKHHP